MSELGQTLEFSGAIWVTVPQFLWFKAVPDHEGYT